MTISGIDRNTDSIEFCEDRVDLAAAFRWTARLNMHEAVSNHFSCMVSDREFLVNPRGRHFAKVRASELLLVKLDDGERADVDVSALAIHGAIHRAVPAARGSRGGVAPPRPARESTGARVRPSWVGSHC